MIKIETKNTGKSISEKKLISLFTLANNSSQIVNTGSILITKESPDNFHIAHNNKSIGSIKINRKGNHSKNYSISSSGTIKVNSRGNQIKNYIVTLKDTAGNGVFKIPHTYLYRTNNAESLEPAYEEWTHNYLNNSADIFMFYKVFHDEEKMHHYETEVFKYGEKLNITGINIKKVFTLEENPTEQHFDTLFLSSMAFNHPEIFFELFKETDFKKSLLHQNLEDNIKILKMYKF